MGPDTGDFLLQALDIAEKLDLDMGAVGRCEYEMDRLSTAEREGRILAGLQSAYLDLAEDHVRDCSSQTCATCDRIRDEMVAVLARLRILHSATLSQEYLDERHGRW